MNQQLLLLSEENEEAKKLPNYLNGGQQLLKGNTPQAIIKAVSPMAVQAHIEDIGGREATHGMVQIQQKKRNKSRHMIGSIQQQWGERDDPEISIEVQKEKNVPSVTVDVQQYWNQNGKISSAPARIQQNVKKEILSQCVTMQLEENLGGEMSLENIHWQFSNTAENISSVKQQAQHGEEIIAAEMKQQQAEEGAPGMDSKDVQEAKESILKETLPQQLRWNQDSKQLMLENFLQEENKLKKMVTEKKLHNETPNAESTGTLIAHLGNENEEDSKKASSEFLQKNVLAQQLPSLNKGAQKIVIEEKEPGHKEQIIYKKQKSHMPNYFVAIPITNDQVSD